MTDITPDRRLQGYARKTLGPVFPELLIPGVKRGDHIQLSVCYASFFYREMPMLIANTDDEILACFDVLKELRPDMEPGSFLETIRMMQGEGFELSCLKAKEEVVCVAGYRVYYSLAANGKALYVYDLVTAELHRSKGYGETMLADLKAHAHETGCVCIHLDSNTKRHGAHKFYLRNGYHIGAFHFLEFFE